MRKGWDNFSSFISYEVGAGTQVKFYNDLWCVDQSLKGGFPELLWLARKGKLQWQITINSLMVISTVMLLF